MLDRDLAELYGVETKRLKEQVNRNIERFPERYMFELTEEENVSSRSQFATLKRGENIKYLPYAFTEHGILMLANVLKSGRAIQMSIRIIDLFVKMREALLTNKDILIKLEQLEKKFIQQDNKMEKYKNDINLIFAYLKELISPQQEPRKKIGYKLSKE
jgi:phage regulator Rha-like protein